MIVTIDQGRVDLELLWDLTEYLSESTMHRLVSGFFNAEIIDEVIIDDPDSEEQV
jgi:hypothetical protein